jgi:TRAP-type C4-dicarboxylate transport system permease small subunit
MAFLVKSKRIIQRINILVCSIGMYLLIPMMFITTTDVMARSFFARPITSSIELSEYMLAVLILLGLGYTEQVKSNVKVGFVLEKFSPRFQAVTDIITILLSLFIIFILVWQGWLIAMKETTVSFMLRIPQTPFRLLVSVGGFLLGLELIIDLINACNKLKRR